MTSPEATLSLVNRLRYCVATLAGSETSAYLPLAHQRFAGVGAGPEVHLRLVGRPRLAGRGIVRVVFAESAFVETAAGLEGQRHVAGDAHRIDFELGVGDAVRRGEIEVFEHLAHDVFPRIARLVERLAVVGVDLPVIPRHGPEGLDLVHVEIGAPKACDAFVMVENRLAGRSRRKLPRK